MTRGGVTFLLIALCAAADDGPLITSETAAKRFFEADDRDAGAFGRMIAKWRLPDLAKAPFVDARMGQQRWVGWLLDEHTLLTAAYSLVRFSDPADVVIRPAKPRDEIDRIRSADGASALLLATHWVAALRRDDQPAAAAAWKEFRRRYDDGTKFLARNGRNYLYGELMFSWRSAWDGYRRTALALAALDAWEALATEERWRETVRSARRGVRATPLQLPAIPDANAPATDRARAMVLHLRDLQPCVAISPGGCLYLDTPPVKRLVALGRAAYPALVAALEHPGLTDAWVGRVTWKRDVTIGEAAGAVLQRELGFLDRPEVMRAWIASGAWKTGAATGDWFLEHARNPVVQEVNARHASDTAARRHFARLYPQAQLAIASRLGGALAREAMKGLHRCGVDTHPRREEAVACARRCERATLEAMLEKLRPELQTVVLEALGGSADPAAIPAVVRQLTNLGHVFPPKPERAGPRAVRFHAVIALERLTGEDFGAARAKTESDWLAAVQRARDWAARRK